jgi:hypothetical protein
MGREKRILSDAHSKRFLGTTLNYYELHSSFCGLIDTVLSFTLKSQNFNQRHVPLTSKGTGDLRLTKARASL